MRLLPLPLADRISADFRVSALLFQVTEVVLVLAAAVAGSVASSVLRQSSRAITCLPLTVVCQCQWMYDLTSGFAGVACNLLCAQRQPGVV